MFNGVEHIKESVFRFDNDPTRLQFTKNDEEATTMSKEEFVIHMIQHHEDFPNVGEISVPDASAVIGHLVPDKSIPMLTPIELAQLWNRLVHDPAVMNID